jgi:integrase/recombinase XerD
MISDTYVEECLLRTRTWIELRGLRPNTLLVYEGMARRFISHVGKPLGDIAQQDVEQYLLNEYVHKGKSAATRNVALAAIDCLMRATKHPSPSTEILRAKVRRRSPEILNKDEVARLLAATKSLKYRAIFMLAYGAGLRVGEASALATTDLDSQRMLIHVRDGKTGPRNVMMSQRLLETLRAYWVSFRPTGPDLFAAGRRGSTQRYLSRTQIHRVLTRAAKAAGITKHVSPHTLRHCFATHMLEKGADVRTVQVLLGHARLETTTTYLHLTTSRLMQVKSPLDDLRLDPIPPRS